MRFEGDFWSGFGGLTLIKLAFSMALHWKCILFAGGFKICSSKIDFRCYLYHPLTSYIVSTLFLSLVVWRRSFFGQAGISAVSKYNFVMSF